MTHIGPSIRISGDVLCGEDLTIHGHVTGRVISRAATLVIAHEAVIDAEVRGTRVVVLGRVKGPISATQRIELGPAATVTGSLSAEQIVMIEGAQFNGRIDMGHRTIAAKVASYRAAHTA